jgi:hypothetical protein
MNVTLSCLKVAEDNSLKSRCFQPSARGFGFPLIVARSWLNYRDFYNGRLTEFRGVLLVSADVLVFQAEINRQHRKEP